MKRSKSYRPGMTGSSGGLSMQQLEDVLHLHLEDTEPTSYVDYEEPIMEDLEESEFESQSFMSYSNSSEERIFSMFCESPATYNNNNTMPTQQTTPSSCNHLFSLTEDEELMFDLELNSRSQSPISPSSQSRAIEIPSTRRALSDPYTQVPALSARGDRQGAFFPNHEDPSLRIQPTHPFQPYAEMARRNSIQQAAAASARAAIPSTAEIGPDGRPKIPTGKYYPANWEKAHNQAPLPIPAELQPLVQHSSLKKPSKPVSYQRHSRTDSEAKRLVHAYQREMVIQASNGIVSIAQGSNTYNYNHQRRGSLSPSSRPLSPRLEPLGSPTGPVTPMSLEDDNGGYLTLGQPMSVEAADLQSAEVTRAIRADRTDRSRRQEKRHKRKDSSHSHHDHWSPMKAGYGQVSF